MEFNGKSILLDMAKRAGYNNKFELVSNHTLFINPQTVGQTGNQNLFRIIRDFSKRGVVVEHEGSSVMCCDNMGPQHAFEWSIGGLKKTDIQINHIYSLPKHVSAYTSLANLCATPAFIAKLTDSDDDIISLLKFRSFDLYGFYIDKKPTKPVIYDSLIWMDSPPIIEDLESALINRLRRSKKSRTAISARKLGWYFSHFKPDRRLE